MIWGVLLVFFLVVIVLGFFESGFFCVPLTVLELVLKTGLASNSEIQLSLPLSVGIKGVRYHGQLALFGFVFMYAF